MANKTTPKTVADYIALVNATEDRINRLTASVLDEIRFAGECLVKAIELSEHTDMPAEQGTKVGWYAANFPGKTPRTYRNWIRVYHNWNRIRAARDTEGVATLTEALALLSVPRKHRPKELQDCLPPDSEPVRAEPAVATEAVPDGRGVPTGEPVGNARNVDAGPATEEQDDHDDKADLPEVPGLDPGGTVAAGVVAARQRLVSALNRTAPARLSPAARRSVRHALEGLRAEITGAIDALDAAG